MQFEVLKYSWRYTQGDFVDVQWCAFVKTRLSW